jgi:hypothetical protein
MLKISQGGGIFEICEVTGGCAQGQAGGISRAVSHQEFALKIFQPGEILRAMSQIEVLAIQFSAFLTSV